MLLAVAEYRTRTGSTLKGKIYSKFIPLTHTISLASLLWDIGKQCRPRPDAALSGVWSRSSLFAYKNFNYKYNKNEKNTPDIPWMTNGLTQCIWMGKSLRFIWVKCKPLFRKGIKTFYSVTSSWMCFRSMCHQACVKMQRFTFTPRMRIVSYRHLLSIDTFYSVQWFC